MKMLPITNYFNVIRKMRIRLFPVTKSRKRYEKFGENLKYLTIEEWKQFIDSIEKKEHRLMMKLIYETGCRVGEFVRMQMKHLDLKKSTIYIPKENTKTGKSRVSSIPYTLTRELKEYLREAGMMEIWKDSFKNSESYVFSSDDNKHYSENRIRQIFQKHIFLSGLDREYGKDSLGRSLHNYTVHSLRHSHIMHYIHFHRIPIFLVQRQVGHTNIQSSMAYINPSDEMVRQAYNEAREQYDRRD